MILDLTSVTKQSITQTRAHATVADTDFEIATTEKMRRRHLYPAHELLLGDNGSDCQRQGKNKDLISVTKQLHRCELMPQ